MQITINQACAHVLVRLCCCYPSAFCLKRGGVSRRTSATEAREGYTYLECPIRALMVLIPWQPLMLLDCQHLFPRWAVVSLKDWKISRNSINTIVTYLECQKRAWGALKPLQPGELLWKTHLRYSIPVDLVRCKMNISLIFSIGFLLSGLSLSGLWWLDDDVDDADALTWLLKWWSLTLVGHVVVL